MAFNKFDPANESEGRVDPSAKRRAALLKWGWLITMIYTAIGFVFLGVFYFWGNPF